MTSPRRPRRLRRTAGLRRLVEETRLSVDSLVQPLFVVPGSGVETPISSLPGHFQRSSDLLEHELQEVTQLGIPAVILFGVPTEKDSTGSRAADADGLVPQAIRAIKRSAPELVVITDVCLCSYTSHGHCGLLVDGEIDNDASTALLGRIAVAHAQAGADVVAPSAMMDGQVAAIRQALDAAGLGGAAIMSYSAKYASGFYGPFREAADSAPAFGDRASYQMDPPNAAEAMREIETDLAEGADIVMVKPALAYLDVLARAKQMFGVPTAAYSVSGEFAMIEAAAERGWLDRDRAVLEVATAIRRAGADILISYHAKHLARLLSGRQAGATAVRPLVEALLR